MKQFLAANWHRLTMAFSTLIFSIGFAVWAIKSNPAQAGTPQFTKSTKDLDDTYFESGGAIYRVYWVGGQAKRWSSTKILDLK